MIPRACDLCEGELAKSKWTPALYCDECGSYYHYFCWREYNRLHDSHCRVCDERQAEDLAEESKGG
jgi:hypothetical protein